MAETQVKCYYCGQSFYKSKEEYEKPVTNRYAHKICCNIHKKIEEELGATYRKSKVTAQIKDFIQRGITPEEILLTLEYWYDVDGGDPTEAAGGIGIVPFVKDEAIKYFNKKEQIANNDFKISDYITDTKVIKIKPKPIRKPVGVNLFNLK